MAAASSVRNEDPALVRLYQLINDREESSVEKITEFENLLNAHSEFIRKGSTLLFCAAQKAKSAFVEILLDKGADPYDKSGAHSRTAIDAASWCMYQNRIAEYVTIFESFAKHGVNFFDYEVNRDESYVFGGTLVEKVLFTNWDDEEADFSLHCKLIEVLVSNGAFSNTVFKRIPNCFPEDLGKVLQSTIQAAKRVFEQSQQNLPEDRRKVEPPHLRGAAAYDRRSSDFDAEKKTDSSGVTPREIGPMLE